MTEQMFKVVMTATAEVRDADGNLIGSSPVEFEQIMTEAEITAMIEGE